MRRIHGRSLIPLALITLLQAPTLASAASVSAGKPCSKAGISKTVGKTKFTCVKKSGVLVWSKSVRKPKTPVATPTPTPSPKSTPKAIPTPDTLLDVPGLDPALSAEDALNAKVWTTLAVRQQESLFGTRMTPFESNISRSAVWLAEQDCKRRVGWTTCVSDRTMLFQSTWAFAGCTPAPVEIGCYQVANLSNFRGDDYLWLKTFVHEVHHILQAQTHRDYTADYAPTDTVRRTGPTWLIEGLAEYVAYFVVSELELTYMRATTADWEVWAKRVAYPLREFETIDGERDIVNLYHLYAVAVDELLKLNNNSLKSAISYYRILEQKAPWREAFQKAFGLSVEDFYAYFERQRPKP